MTAVIGWVFVAPNTLMPVLDPEKTKRLSCSVPDFNLQQVTVIGHFHPICILHVFTSGESEHLLTIHSATTNYNNSYK